MSRELNFDNSTDLAQVDSHHTFVIYKHRFENQEGVLLRLQT